jgi:hypothetical protein
MSCGDSASETGLHEQRNFFSTAEDCLGGNRKSQNTCIVCGSDNTTVSGGASTGATTAAPPLGGVSDDRDLPLSVAEGFFVALVRWAGQPTSRRTKKPWRCSSADVLRLWRRAWKIRLPADREPEREL